LKKKRTRRLIRVLEDISPEKRSVICAPLRVVILLITEAELLSRIF